jgi:hypothetical protein
MKLSTGRAPKSGSALGPESGSALGPESGSALGPVRDASRQYGPCLVMSRTIGTIATIILTRGAIGPVKVTV